MKNFILRSSFMVGAFIFTVLLVLYPKEALDASVRGLTIWWEVVFPSLLPFFITAELLISFGAITFIGILFEPFMRPLFNVPGAGSLALMMGMVSGYPTGAKITARLREKKQITKREGERLVSFTNASSPLFIFGAIAVGFFNDPKIGLLLAFSHYGGNILVGILLKYFHKDQVQKQRLKRETRKNIFAHAISETYKENKKQTDPLGEILGKAVYHSVKTLIIVGGFITFFSVLTSILLEAKILNYFAFLFSFLLSLVNISNDLNVPLIVGLFELSIGVQQITEQLGSSLRNQLIIVSFILGFNGFSIQAQIASILSSTDIRFKPYFFARLLHGFLASILTVYLYKFLFPKPKILPTILSPFEKEKTINLVVEIYQFLSTFGPFITIIAITFALFYHIYLMKHTLR